MFGRKDGETESKDSDTTEAQAYEDNWYRSLKALAEQRNGEDVDEQDVDEVQAEVEAPTVETPEVETAPEPSPAESAEAHDVIPQTELEMRAGQLLERLRTLQQLGEARDEERDTSQSSVWQG